MKPIVKKWIEYAANDLDIAHRLFKSPKPTHRTYLIVLWQCQQVIEKMLKMIIVKNGKEPLKIHDLPRLHQLANLELSNEYKDFIDKLNKYYLRPRYPDLTYPPPPEITKTQAKLYIQKTEELFLCLKKLAQNSQKK